MCNDKLVSRRKVMKWVVGGITVASGGVIGIPSILSTLSPTIKHDKTERWNHLGLFSSFPPGQVVTAKVDNRLETKNFMWMIMPKSVYVWRKVNDEVIVYSRSCTDLGCPVNFDSGSECFFCPCHGGIFSKEGNVMSGPPKNPLYRYQTRIIDGFLEIDLASVPVVA